MEATKVRLEAVAYPPGTDGSNPFPSSGESATNLGAVSGRSRDLIEAVESLSLETCLRPA
jgi:hypothetical protein